MLFLLNDFSFKLWYAHHCLIVATKMNTKAHFPKNAKKSLIEQDRVLTGLISLVM